jgi:hypothetical protein
MGVPELAWWHPHPPHENGRKEVGMGGWLRPLSGNAWLATVASRRVSSACIFSFCADMPCSCVHSVPALLPRKKVAAEQAIPHPTHYSGSAQSHYPGAHNPTTQGAHNPTTRVHTLQLPWSTIITTPGSTQSNYTGGRE